MKTPLLCLAVLSGAVHAATQTVTIPVQVTVTSTGTTISVLAQSMTIPITAPPTKPTISTTALPAGKPGVAYSAALAASGGTAPFTWTATGLPPGLSVNGSQISGTPTAVGGYSVVVKVTDSASLSASATFSLAITDPPPPTTSTCAMQLGTMPVIFCDTFDAPAGIGNRAGDLDGNVWGVSRVMGQGTNFGQNQYGLWNATQIKKCDGSTPTVNAPADIIICNGQLREAMNDNNSGSFDAGDVGSLAMYPKQPFDFAGRTGTVSFDVSNDAGPHGAWPEFWMSDLPVPDPFNHGDAWEALPANGFGLRFDSVAPIGMQGACPNSNNLDKLRWTVESVAVSRGYVLDDTLGLGPRIVKLQILDCAIESSGPGNMNHVEVKVSQNQIDVYATDAGATTLKHIAVASNANLTFTRGLIWLEDVHYNGDKILDSTRASQRVHTFSWDNVAFDGPFTYRDFSYDAPDANTPTSNGARNLGKFSLGGQSSTWNVPGLPANPQAALARVLFNFNGGGVNPSVLNVTVNGHAHSVPWPYPDNNNYLWRTFAVTIPLTDLVAGTNVVQLGADKAQVFVNVDIVLVNVPGGVPVLPGSKNTYPGT